jgi:hypothetical protein
LCLFHGSLRSRGERWKAELREVVEGLAERDDPNKVDLETISVKPYRKGLEIELVALLRLPIDERGEQAW